ncbi:hypothetical protein FT663_04003 [Candidozyma haemuli var. vulneris]|nr:hypothetical protein FT662_04607 [[Candida] haemuloni var. vulneris]KAF3988534.1 hypothetical protein FT663_04003 [[Candida] haemuloni var. vulneris]
MSEPYWAVIHRCQMSKEELGQVIHPMSQNRKVQSDNTNSGLRNPSQVQETSHKETKGSKAGQTSPFISLQSFNASGELLPGSIQPEPSHPCQSPVSYHQPLCPIHSSRENKEAEKACRQRFGYPRVVSFPSVSFVSCGIGDGGGGGTTGCERMAANETCNCPSVPITRPLKEEENLRETTLQTSHFEPLRSPVSLDRHGMADGSPFSIHCDGLRSPMSHQAPPPSSHHEIGDKQKPKPSKLAPYWIFDCEDITQYVKPHGQPSSFRKKSRKKSSSTDDVSECPSESNEALFKDEEPSFHICPCVFKAAFDRCHCLASHEDDQPEEVTLPPPERMRDRTFRVKASGYSSNGHSTSLRFLGHRFVSKVYRLSVRLRGRFRRGFTNSTGQTFGFKRVLPPPLFSTSSLKFESSVSEQESTKNPDYFQSKEDIARIVKPALKGLFAALLSRHLDASPEAFEETAFNLVKEMCIKKEQFFALVEGWEFSELCANLSHDVLGAILWDCMVEGRKKVDAIRDKRALKEAARVLRYEIELQEPRIEQLSEEAEVNEEATKSNYPSSESLLPEREDSENPWLEPTIYQLDPAYIDLPEANEDNQSEESEGGSNKPSDEITSVIVPEEVPVTLVTRHTPSIDDARSIASESPDGSASEDSTIKGLNCATGGEGQGNKQSSPEESTTSPEVISSGSIASSGSPSDIASALSSLFVESSSDDRSLQRQQHTPITSPEFSTSTLLKSAQKKKIPGKLIRNMVSQFDSMSELPGNTFPVRLQAIGPSSSKKPGSKGSQKENTLSDCSRIPSTISVD